MTEEAYTGPAIGDTRPAGEAYTNPAIGGIRPTDEAYMGLAIEEARLAGEAGEIPVGCVIVREGRVIARGHNLRQTQKDPTAHAEVVAIRAAARALGDWRLRGCTLYVTLEPCPMCAGAIVQSRVSRVVYGAHDPRYGCAGSVYRIPEDPALGSFCPCDGGVLEDVCAGLLGEAFGRNA